MIDYEIGLDEVILLENNNVTWIADQKFHVTEMILTNKNIILVYDKKTGFFSKEKDVVKKPLSEIKSFNGNPMVEQVRLPDYGVCLQIQFLNGKEVFVFESWGKKHSAKWVNSVYEIITGNDASIPENVSGFSGLNGFKDSFKNIAEQAKEKVATVSSSAIDTVSEMANNTADRTPNSANNYGYNTIQSNNQTLSSNQMSFCPNCGAKIVKGSKFCSGCGSPVGAGSSMPQPISQNNSMVREQKFAGIVLKCPNCGATIGQTTAVCPECGYYITGQAATNSVQIFSDKIMALEANRKKAGIGQMLGAATDPVDKQKLSLIRSFPIPNTIDDIYDFMLLAIANIDVRLSKKSLMNRMDTNNVESKFTMPKKISDAWVLKLQQAYQMASNAFPGEPIFEQIKQIYTDKMRELKIKVE